MAATSPPLPVKIAFFEDLSPENADERVAPAAQGAELAFDTAAISDDLPVTVELVPFDTRGDPEAAAEAARTVAEDPAFVGAIGAPYLDGQRELGDVLDAAGVPVVTLSGLAPDLATTGWTTWRRAVATQEQEAAALAAYVDGLRPTHRGVCLAGGGGRVGTGFLRWVSEALSSRVIVRERVEPTDEARARYSKEIAAAGCGVVVWGGFAEEGAALRVVLVEHGLRVVRFVGGGGLRDATYLLLSGPAGRRTVATCPCADVSSSTGLAAQRFVQDYQADFGVPPGPYAVEGWDAARMFVGVLRAGATTKSDVLAALRATPTFDGLATTYAFGPDGELDAASASVFLNVDRGGRWIQLGG